MHYKKAITTYGIMQPLVLVLLIVGIAGGAAFYVNSQLSEKKQAFANYQKNKEKARILEIQSQENLEELERWQAIISSNARNTLEDQFNQAAASARSPQLDRVRNAIANRPGPIALAMEGQASQTYDLSFRGAYRDVQAMLVDFEYRLPNLFLESIAVEPEKGSQTSASFDLTYTVWRP